MAKSKSPVQHCIESPEFSKKKSLLTEKRKNGNKRKSSLSMKGKSQLRIDSIYEQHSLMQMQLSRMDK
jgi:hypothetical protein